MSQLKLPLYYQTKSMFFEAIKNHKLLSNYQNIIFKAFSYGEEQHAFETRKHSKEPYFVHCTSVALSILEEPDIDKDFVIAALLHDTVENTDTTIDYLEKNFGLKVATIVKGLTKLPSSYRKEMGDEKYYQEGFFGPITEVARKFSFIWKIKLADRLNNLETYWEFASQSKKDEYVWETYEILRLSTGVETQLKEKIRKELALHYQ